MLKYPLNNIQDTNFWHYTLQLSTYAWMIQKHEDNDEGNDTYLCAVIILSGKNNEN